MADMLSNCAGDVTSEGDISKETKPSRVQLLMQDFSFASFELGIEKSLEGA